MTQDGMAPLLKRAQEEFGYANQVTVTTEELCELAAVLSKYPRYPNHELASAAIRGKVVEEMADVIICLEHLYMIFKVQDNEIDAAVGAKLERLERWLDSGKGFHVTTQDREVRPLEPKGI
jgi:hypothetical protein